MGRDGHLYTQSMHVQNPGSSIEDVRCVLRGLRDGVSGQYSFVLDEASMPGFIVDFHTLNVLPTGNVVRSTYPFRDLSPTTYSHAYLTRKPAAFFDACLALPLGAELFACLTTWADAAASGCPVCR